MLEHTVVIVLGEFGRTPNISNLAGSEHHLGVSARRAEPPRHVRSEAGCTGRASRRVQADPDEPPRHANLRVDAAASGDGRQVDDYPLGDTHQR